MSKSEFDRAIAQHYGQNQLTQKIVKALKSVRSDPGAPVTVADLEPLDQLHHGGLGLTMQMAEKAGVAQGMRILDAGSGIGGPARYLANRFGCKVDALDLTPEFVETGAELDGMVGLSGQITHCQGSVTDMPFGDEEFDLVWSQNVTMNIADKAAMFAEVCRVLRPGGTFTLSHMGAGNGQEIPYPLPWARHQSESFPTPPGDMFDLLKNAGFRQVTDHPPPPASTPPPAPPADGLDDTVVMGVDMPLRRANAMAAVSDGRLITMLITAEKPKSPRPKT